MEPLGVPAPLLEVHAADAAEWTLLLQACAARYSQVEFAWQDQLLYKLYTNQLDGKRLPLLGLFLLGLSFARCHSLAHQTVCDGLV